MNILKKISNYKIMLNMMLWQLRGDVQRMLSWSVLGGKKEFTKKSAVIASQHKWVFILGCNNSGTSLLQRILNKSGQVSTWHYEGQRYTRVLPRAMRRGYERVWMEYRDDLTMPENSEDSLGPRLIHDWTTSLDQPLKPIVLEKTPANLLRMRWLQKVFPQSYFIGLVRNGYAVTEGIRRKSHKEIGRAASHWAAANKAMLKEAKSIDRFLEISYEDLAEKPAETTKTLANFLDLDAEALGAAMSEKYELKNVTGISKQGLTNMNKVSIDRLSEEDISLIKQNAGEMLDHFGYRPD